MEVSLRLSDKISVDPRDSGFGRPFLTKVNLSVFVTFNRELGESLVDL